MNVTLRGWTRESNAIEIAFNCATKRCTYDDVDFRELELRFGAGFLDRICGQLAMMEAIPLAGLAPDSIDLGPAARYFTPRFESLWRTVLRETGAQWRYERDLPNYAPTVLLPISPSSAFGTFSPDVGGEGSALVFFGGGKDSLASITLLREAGIPFATFAYSHADYGAPTPQHALIDRLLDAANVTHRHRMRAEDDIENRGDLICAETPISLWYALPLMLQHGHRELVLGNERSADAPNLTWDATGERVNHQWGKSSEAERLLNDYLRAELLPDASYFSILRPLHDGLIVSLLRDEPAVRLTHSCNVAKPWCERCPKCAYVWLQLAAYLPRGIVESMFRSSDLFAANEATFRRLLGIDSHKPFECVGEPGEARLALELCRRRGIGGPAAERLANALPPIDVDALAAEYLVVHEDENIPPSIHARVLPLMRAAEARISANR